MILVNITEQVIITAIIEDMEVKLIVKVMKGSGDYMTEKRFTVPQNYRCIQDNLTKEHYMCEDKTEAINLAYLLNSLADENEQLKKELASFKPVIFESDGKPVTLYQKGDLE